jgi:hypothetical protein
MSPRSRGFLRAALGLLAVSVLMFASFVFGVASARREGRASKLAAQLLNLQHQLRARLSGPPTRKGAGHRQRLPGEPQEAAAKLAALPYLQGYSSAPKTANVTLHVEGATQPGLNFVVSADEPKAFLMDMQGKVLHTWRKDFQAVWPTKEAGSRHRNVYQTFWRRAFLQENGDVLAIFMDYGLIRIDKDSKLLWAYQGRCHHDLFVESGTGNIYVLNRRAEKRDDLRLESWTGDGPVLEDLVTVLSPGGKELRTVSLIDCLLNSAYAPLLEHIKERFDVLHANGIRPVLADKHPVFRKGELLISMREIHSIAAVDLEQKKVTWAATGLWKYQHEPRLLPNGNVLVYDNRGNGGHSQAIEFDPVTRRVAWRYRGEPAEAFSSRQAGAIQRLANGNTLITESENGRAFEVTPAGEIVWDYFNPNRTGEDEELIAALYDVVRLEPGQVRWLEGVQP